MSEFYQELCNMLIRPTRQIYHLYDLGNPLIAQHGKRQDFQILSRNHLKIKCSFYHSLVRDPLSTTATVIYLHSLNGSRLEFISNVEPLIKMGFNVCTLDLSGCGLSDGNYVTLGAHEKWDVLELVKYVHATYNESNFMIWGRSMGAVAAIKFYTLFEEQREVSRQLMSLKILGLVLDSPFSSLNQLAVQIAKNRINIPEIVIKMAFYMIQSSIETKANFKTSELELQNQVKKILCPTLIITSKKDTLVPCEHSLLIFNNISSVDKQLMYIETQHNNNREDSDLQKVYHFLGQKSNTFLHRTNHYTGSQRRIQKLETKPKGRHKNLTLSKDKLNRHQSHKNQFIMPKNNSFFLSHVGRQNSIRIQEDNGPQIKCKARDFSIDKIHIETDKVNYDKNFHFFSAERPKVVFSNETNQTNKPNKKQQKIIDLYSSKLAPVQQKFIQKPFTHSLSYKNMECLKTVKKIKRVQNEIQEKLNEQNEKGKEQEKPKDEKDKSQYGKQKPDEIKSHMNVITAKLKKKPKHMLTKSFLPFEMTENMNQRMPQESSGRTLKKQINAKSSTIIEFSKSGETGMHGSEIKSRQRQKPTTPVSFSTRQIHFGQSVPKPFTPQFPLHSSMRINQIQKRRQSHSKQDVIKIYPMQLISESSKGIQTTLSPKYHSNGNDQNVAKNLRMEETIEGERHGSMRPQFMSCKNVLSSQIIEMRGEGNMQKSKKYLMSGKKVLVEGKEETSILLK